MQEQIKKEQMEKELKDKLEKELKDKLEKEIKAQIETQKKNNIIDEIKRVNEEVFGQYQKQDINTLLSDAIDVSIYGKPLMYIPM